MNILVLGSGGREHALAWKLAASRRVGKVFCAPGNAGTAAVAENLPLDPMDFKALAGACAARRIDSVFVGPEAYLAAGVVDFLESHGIPSIGPKSSSARLESSKAFSKAFMVASGVPTARAAEFRDKRAFEDYIRSQPAVKLVVKKSGLAAGKGVLESADKETLLAFGRRILNDDALVVEEFLEGWEVSVFALTDGNGYRLLDPCTDFKKAHDGDRGPNTGGMGSICPMPLADAALMSRIERETVIPTFTGMKREGIGYKGVLYFGLMITRDGPKVLEYNARFGDPETQVLLPCLDEDLGVLVESMLAGTLQPAGTATAAASGAATAAALGAATAAALGAATAAALGAATAAASGAATAAASGAATAAASGAATAAALGVVVAAAGYPESYGKNMPVEPIAHPPEKDALIFHASTVLSPKNGILTAGGRCFTVVGRGKDLAEASRKAYEAVDAIRFPGAWHRGDIGARFIGGAR